MVTIHGFAVSVASTVGPTPLVGPNPRRFLVVFINEDTGLNHVRLGGAGQELTTTNGALLKAGGNAAIDTVEPRTGARAAAGGWQAISTTGVAATVSGFEVFDE